MCVQYLDRILLVDPVMMQYSPLGFSVKVVKGIFKVNEGNVCCTVNVFSVKVVKGFFKVNEGSVCSIVNVLL